ncbi:ATP-binding protein [Streptosporangium lutulentum]|uniref:ATPase/DNA-binding SARP family transcriptional activator n=1 Tax=Streptosporangium lutulentum TaxID=1461250 RepID=A0ABT9QNV1_9ACTN|nr:BTAD domain-containing putative transcriptional regulator [Streptosporangium lutulentum]MDP9848075.1 putative ATPase/DNA-binding SARP family transcriptional activator [Streptosporangium lutulentum]
MRFGILGSTEVWLSDGRLAAIGGPRLRALLGLLLLDAGRMVTSERLIDGLYGTAPPAGAVNALQAQVSRLRHLLAGDGDVVVRHPAGYLLAVAPESVDAHRFERLAAEGRGALDAGDPLRAEETLREALDLWRGPALADVLEAPFAAAQAARLEELRIAATEDQVEARLALGRHRETVAGLQELVAAHPLRERLRGQLMRALYACGRQADALATYEDARRRLADELGADPSPELAATHLSVLRADLPPATRAPSPAASPPDASQDVRHGIPAQLTTLIGRSGELARIGELLAGARLVTLTGPGGTGKTRLAVETAGRERGDDGEVCFVELAPLADGADVPQAVLGALGLRESGTLPGSNRPAHDPLMRLTSILADRRMLLILDNCEHVVGATAGLAARLLSSCPTLRILATSREALGITGEVLCPIPPLGLPPADASSAEALAFPAVRLFADRASAVRPGFDLGADVDAVLHICRTLDGLPLAIELAAARLRSLPASEIATRLDDRFRLLSRGSRTAQPRHQTLRAVVEWSWDLLDEDERTLARRLTVFAGGADLEAAERVSGLSDVVDVLSGLVDKSLVEVADDRYRMLDTIRAFCAERLAEAGEEEALRRAHGEYFLDLAETADPHLRAARQLEWLRVLDREHDNLHAALHRAIESDPAFALRLMSALAGYWWLRGLRTEGATLAGELLDRLGSGVPDGLSQEYALCVLLVASTGGHDPEIRHHMEAAYSIVMALDELPRQPVINVISALITGPPSDDDYSAMLYRMERIGVDPWMRALMDFGEGHQQLWNGRPAEAPWMFDRALGGFRSIGDRWGIMMTLSALAELAGWHGSMDESNALMSEALGLAEELDATADIAELLRVRADTNVRAGDVDGARADYERAAGLARRVGNPEILASARLGLGEIARLLGDLDDAQRQYEAALACCRPEWYNGSNVRQRIHVALGRLAEARQDTGTALYWHRLALAPGAGPRNLPITALAMEGLAGVALLEDDGERAAFLLGVGTALRGLALAGDPDVDRVRTRARARIGVPAFERAYGRGSALTSGQMASLSTDQMLAIAEGPSATGQ